MGPLIGRHMHPSLVTEGNLRKAEKLVNCGIAEGFQARFAKELSCLTKGSLLKVMLIGIDSEC
jgi:hypothetical protein